MSPLEIQLREALAAHAMAGADMRTVGDGNAATVIVSIPGDRTANEIAAFLAEASGFALARPYDTSVDKFASKVLKLGVVRICFEPPSEVVETPSLPDSLTGALETAPA